MRFKILHTNDIHSRFENFSKITTKLKELKDEYSIVLDAGDFNDFMRIELQGTNGIAGIKLLKIAEYDAIAIGNNETFQGVDTLINMAKNSEVQFLSCNICKDNSDKVDFVKPSIIIERKGVRFLVIGTSPVFNEFYPLLGLGVVNYKEAIVDQLNCNKGKYDVCILLSHLGLIEDKDIAETIAGIDIIIDGHSHILMDEPLKIKDTIIHMSGCYGEHLGVLEFDYNDSIKLCTSINVNVENSAQNVEIINSLKFSKEEAINFLGKPIYSIDEDVWHDVIEENPITNLLADSLRDVLKCEIGLINSGVINGGVRRGKVSLKKLIEICPSPLNPTYIEIKGKYIRQALEESLQTEFCLQEGKGPGFRGRYLGRLHLSGCLVEYSGINIKNILVGNKNIEDEKIYTVATSDYLQRGTGYESLKNNQNEKYNPEFLRDIIREYLIKPDCLQIAKVNRWIEMDESIT
jgi:5'-nucleotidase